jgi:hypothetical protein
MIRKNKQHNQILKKNQFYWRHSIYLMVRNGFLSHRKDVSGRLQHAIEEKEGTD